MAATLARTVRLDGVTIPAGTEETPELRARIANPRSWSGPTELEGMEGAAIVDDGGEPPTTVDELVALIEAAVERVLVRHLVTTDPVGSSGEGQIADGGPSGETVSEPPRGGPGSGEPAWRDYAAAIGLDVSGASDRNEIIALVDARNSGN